jgi:hypothetical protein
VIFPWNDFFLKNQLLIFAPMTSKQFLHYAVVNLLLAYVFLFGSKVQAQRSVENRSSSLNYELLLGLTSASISGVAYQGPADAKGYHLRKNLQNKAGFSAGIGIARTIGRKFEIYSRILWERKGFREGWDSVTQTAISSPTSSSGHSTNNDYLTIALLPQLVIGTSVHLSIGAGGYFGILTSTKTKDEYAYYAAYSNSSFENLDYGLSFSATCRFSLSRKSDFVAQLISSRGLTQVSARHDSFSPAYNNSITLLMGLRFGKGNEWGNSKR